MPQVECGFPGCPDVLARFGPTLVVRIGFDLGYKPGGEPPVLPERDHQALVDTGAAQSCIDSGIAMTLNLPIIDRMQVAGVHGLGEVNVHLAQILIPDLGIIDTGALLACISTLEDSRTAH